MIPQKFRMVTKLTRLVRVCRLCVIISMTYPKTLMTVYAPYIRVYLFPTFCRVLFVVWNESLLSIWLPRGSCSWRCKYEAKT
ncbi:hypothetical protein CPC08DRAFT_206097 [Agrocybe pediades]|nr:hypothetical protein CPC08DRAFT_206097 [Agrocybe pediades]